MSGEKAGLHSSYKADLDEEFPLTTAQVEFYQENGFIRLKQVFKPETLEFIRSEITAAVRKADTTPLEDDDAYAKAFLQVMNLWTNQSTVREFCLGKKLAHIAAQLMKTSGVRMYHDQALYKEPHGGHTPWHCDQFYWPLNTDNTVTAWIPLQPVPMEMGPLEFAAGTHKSDLGRTLKISSSNDGVIAEAVDNGGFRREKGPFDIGEVSFHCGWIFHRADGNSTVNPRQVMTIIMMDENTHLIEPQHDNHRADMERFLPGLKAGDLAASPLNPVLWSSTQSATAA